MPCQLWLKNAFKIFSARRKKWLKRIEVCGIAACNFRRGADTQPKFAHAPRQWHRGSPECSLSPTGARNPNIRTRHFGHKQSGGTLKSTPLPFAVLCFSTLQSQVVADSNVRFQRRAHVLSVTIHLFFIDFEKTFDRVNWWCTWRVVRGRGIPQKPGLFLVTDIISSRYLWRSLRYLVRRTWRSPMDSFTWSWTLATNLLHSKTCMARREWWEHFSFSFLNSF